MATGGGDQVWTWKKRKTVAASRAAMGGNEITTVSLVSCPWYIPPPYILYGSENWWETSLGANGSPPLCSNILLHIVVVREKPLHIMR